MGWRPDDAGGSLYFLPDARAPGAEPAPAEAAERTSLGELAALCVRLGATAFGGPAAHIAMMQDEVVTRRRGLSEERFLDPC